MLHSHDLSIIVTICKVPADPGIAAPDRKICMYQPKICKVPAKVAQNLVTLATCQPSPASLEQPRGLTVVIQVSGSSMVQRQQATTSCSCSLASPTTIHLQDPDLTLHCPPPFHPLSHGSLLFRMAS